MPSSAKTSTSSGTRGFEAIPFQDTAVARLTFERVSAKLTPALAGALPTLLAESPDPDSSLLLFERLAMEASAEVLRLLESHPFLAHYAIAVFGSSRYLGETLVQNTDQLHTFLREKKLDRSFSHEEFSEALARFRSRSFERDNSLLLARFKRREYVRIMLRDVLNIAPLAETTAEISALSDVLIEEALREAESVMERRFGLPQRLDSEGRALTTPFAVLSLGKLGGNELNYSSDIDLLYIYGDGPEPPAAPISNREYFVRLAQQVTEILCRPTAEGAVFRIDLRLRPQGNEGELAISLSNALQYYAETAHDWERQALIKVRHSAGNLQLARAFIRRIQPQVYSAEINFAAIKTALVAREKIDRKRRRQAAAERHESLDVKIDRGGIRDIEFLVQCLQRVYGGSEPWLRSGGTLFSLQKLHDKRHISGHDFHELNSAYTFLRHLEHRLQLQRGQQVHRLPRSPQELAILQRAMAGLTPGYQLADLASAVKERMAAVAEIYQRVIYQQQAGRSFLPVPGDFQLRSQVEGAILDPSQPQLLERLAEDAPDLWSCLGGQNLGPAGTKNLLRFLGSGYGSSERYAVVLRHQQAIARSLQLFESSEYLVEILTRYPEEIETLGEINVNAPPVSSSGLFDLSPPLFGEAQFAGGDAVFSYIANSSATSADKIALLRKHFRHRMFAAGARDIAELRPVYSSFAETTSAAEAAIAAAFGIARSPDGLAILALGRLGSREFDLLSDADLLFVCDPDGDRLVLTKSAEQIMQTLAAYTQDGLVFPVDARLRPHGAEGELLVTPQQLESYFSSEAQPWEALTYTKIRFVAGSAELGRRAFASTETLFSRFADHAAFAAAIHEMRQRLQDASTPEKSIRTSAGALYDVDFLSSFLLVKQAIRPKTGTIRDRLWRCAAAEKLDKKDAAILDHAAELARTVEHLLRLVIGRNTRWLPAAEHPRRAIEKLASQILRRDFSEGLEQELLQTFAEVRKIYDRVVC
jgi:[glutamine synthetase] adenylyltransferase / [glutamine synthetase]-adenylyl-L-tyrosine phosphorylase